MYDRADDLAGAFTEEEVEFWQQCGHKIIKNIDYHLGYHKNNLRKTSKLLAIRWIVKDKISSTSN